jgi:hypothetical protein
MVVPELAREGAFRGRMARHLVLHGIEHGAPFGVGFLTLFVVNDSLG